MENSENDKVARIKTRNERLIESITKIINSGDKRFLQKIEILIEDFEELEKLKQEFQALDNEL